MKTYLNIPFRRFICAVSASLALFASSVHAVVIFSDGNYDGMTNPNEADWYSYNASSSGTAWVFGTSATIGYSLRNSGSSMSNTSITKQFSEITLEVGQSLVVSLDFVSSSSSGQLQLSLLDSDSAMTSNQLGGTDPISGATGYAFVQSLSSTATTPTYRETEVGGSTSALYTSSSSSSIGSGSGAHTLAITITNTGSGLEISSLLDSVDYGSYTISTADAQFTFDTIRLASLSINSSFNASNVKLSLIPELSESSFLMAFGAVLVIGMRRCLKVAKPNV